MTYFGTKLTDNISRREPEGYLLCLNVPVARTGYQEYLPGEIGQTGDEMIRVYRPEEEVFSPATMASFEGMPVTDDHPAAPEGVTAENIRYLQKGHAHNIRRGTGKDEDLLLADLIITDPDLSDRILSGKREISCGYNYTLCEEDGNFIQREIRGNHVAVVDAGRAGHRVSIQDHRKTLSDERRTETMTKPEPLPTADCGEEMLTTLRGIHDLLSRLIAAPLTDEDLPEHPDECTDEDLPDAGEVAEAVTEALEAAAEIPQTDDDPVEELIGEILETAETDEDEPVEEEAVSVVLEPSEDEDPGNEEKAADALRAALGAFRPQLRKMTPAQRRKFNADVATRLKKTRRAADKRSAYAAMNHAKAADRVASDLGRRIMAARNANLRKR